MKAKCSLKTGTIVTIPSHDEECLGMCQLCIDDPSIHSAFPGANHDFQQCIEKVSVAFVFRKNAEVISWILWPEFHGVPINISASSQEPACCTYLKWEERLRICTVHCRQGKSQDNARLGYLSCIFMYAIYLLKT